MSRPWAGRLGTAAPGLLVTGLVVHLATGGLAPSLRIGLAVAAAGLLLVPVLRASSDGLVPGAVLAIAATVLGGTAGVLELGLLGTALLSVVTAVSTVGGAAPWRRVVLALVVGGLATVVVAAAAATDVRLPAVLAVAGVLGVAVASIVVVERLEPAPDDPRRAGDRHED